MNKNKTIQTKKEENNNNPTMNIIIGGVYERNDSSREFIVVDGFTAYDSEGEYLGTEEKPIYHAIVTYHTLFTHNGETTDINRNSMRLAVDYIVERFHKIGVNLVK